MDHSERDVAQRPSSSDDEKEDVAVVKQSAAIGNTSCNSAMSAIGTTTTTTKKLRRRKKLLVQPERPVPHRMAEDNAERGAVQKQPKKKSDGGDDNDDSLFRMKVSSLVVALLIIVLVIVYLRPPILFPTTTTYDDHHHHHPVLQRLPRRTIMTVYPRHLHIGQALPTVAMGYAIASPDNARERAAVRYVAAQRVTITTPSRGTSQSIGFNPIEHGDFVHKLITKQPGALDYFCGAGYQQAYQRLAQEEEVEANSSSGSSSNNSNTDSGQALDDMLLACLLHSGTADGYVKYTVQVHTPLSRRTNGVAAQYRDEKRILSDFLWLPILERVSHQSRTTRKKSKTNAATTAADVPMVPATTLPYAMTQQLLLLFTTTTMVEPALRWYRHEWEEFLYTAIQAERDKWTLLTAVCSDVERAELVATTQLVATSCRSNSSSSSSSDNPDHCCWVFDETLRPNE